MFAYADVMVPRGFVLLTEGNYYCHPHDISVAKVAALDGSTARDVINAAARLRYLERRAKVRGERMVWPKTPAELWEGAR